MSIHSRKPRHFSDKTEKCVGVVDGKTVWVDVPYGFFVYVVHENGEYDTYGTFGLRYRQNTNDFLDAVWVMLVMTDNVSL